LCSKVIKPEVNGKIIYNSKKIEIRRGQGRDHRMSPGNLGSGFFRRAGEVIGKHFPFTGRHSIFKRLKHYKKAGLGFGCYRSEEYGRLCGAAKVSCVICIFKIVAEPCQKDKALLYVICW